MGWVQSPLRTYQLSDPQTFCLCPSVPSPEGGGGNNSAHFTGWWGQTNCEGLAHLAPLLSPITLRVHPRRSTRRPLHPHLWEPEFLIANTCHFLPAAPVQQWKPPQPAPGPGSEGRKRPLTSGGWGLVCRGPSGGITLPVGSAQSLGSPAGWGPAASSRSGLIAHTFLAPLCPLPYSPLPARCFWNHLPNKLLTLQSLFPACPAALGITIDVESQPH